LACVVVDADVVRFAAIHNLGGIPYRWEQI